MANTTLNGSMDSWTYSWGSSVYSAHRYYTYYFRDMHAHDTFKWIWKSWATMKIKVFGWLLMVDRLNTRNMLKRRHYNIGEDHNYLLRDSPDEETLEHLFFECPFSFHCWEALHIPWAAGETTIQRISEAKLGWNRPLFMETFLLAAWSIWKERNNKHFRRIAPSKESWLRRFKEDFSLLTHRVKEKHKDSIPSILASIV